MRRMHSLVLFVLVAAPLAVRAEDYLTLRGQVKAAELPKPAVIKIGGDHKDKPVCCKDGDLISNQFVVDAKSLGLMNVVVWLRPDDTDRTVSFPKERIKPALAAYKGVKVAIDQPKCQFEPRILAAREGDTLVIKNSSGIGHNAKTSGGGITEQNPLIPAGKEFELPDKLMATRFSILVECNIHSWMRAEVRVFDHPYFATTDKDGKFEIKDVPAGKWRLVYWHELGYHKKNNLGELIDVKADAKDGTAMDLKPIVYEPPPPDTKDAPKAPAVGK